MRVEFPGTGVSELGGIEAVREDFLQEMGLETAPDELWDGNNEPSSQTVQHNSALLPLLLSPQFPFSEIEHSGMTCTPSLLKKLKVVEEIFL